MRFFACLENHYSDEIQNVKDCFTLFFAGEFVANVAGLWTMKMRVIVHARIKAGQGF
jgi:hypothetical protein